MPAILSGLSSLSLSLSVSNLTDHRQEWPKKFKRGNGSLPRGRQNLNWIYYFNLSLFRKKEKRKKKKEKKRSLFKGQSNTGKR
jgi:hypothetical protein